MKCSRCQHENASEARYCSACGVRLDLTCSSCGHGNAPGSVFCNQCGHALTLAGELGMRPLTAHCHLGLGKLSRRTGKREQAREHLTAATTMYREMDMRFWLEQAEAIMGALP
jgi:hypothetical protein